MCPNLGSHHQADLSSHPTIDRLRTIEYHFIVTSNDEALSSLRAKPSLPKLPMRIDKVVLLYLFQPMASFVFSTSFIKYRHCAQFPSLAYILAASSTNFSSSNDEKKITFYDSEHSNRFSCISSLQSHVFANFIFNGIYDCSEIPDHESLGRLF
ncbi:hypothetical protein EAE96_005787 [Botrytis aclada]|nr:hypothetical protein EAE96_005787 [Botrytis aclada]